MMQEVLKEVRGRHPLVHCMTNYVTVNDCANLLLACGASPIMADAAEEAEEIAALCHALVLNIGTLNTQTLKAMRLAGLRAKKSGHPIVLDPVGAGASRLRRESAMALLTEVHPDVLRGNVSELKVLCRAGAAGCGVDAAAADQVTEGNLPELLALLRDFAAEYGCVTAVSGAIDLIAAPDGRACAVRNGDPLMPLVTGSGCMLTALCAACCAAWKQDLFTAVCAAHCAMGIAGETAKSRLLPGEGNASYRTRIIDAFCGVFQEGSVRCEMF